MKKKLSAILVGLATGLFVFGMVGIANATILTEGAWTPLGGTTLSQFPNLQVQL